MPAATAFPDLTEQFRVIPENRQVRLDDMRLPDGSPMVGADGLLIPSARSYSMIVNTATRVYSYRYDEAMRDNFVSARAMRRDAFLEGLFEERILPTINREWQLEVDDPEDPNQRRVRDELTEVVKAIPDFDAFKRANLDGVWFGRAGAQWAYQRKKNIKNRWGLSRWDPLHGDSIQFTFDGVPAILLDTQTVSWYQNHGATFGPNGDIRPTDRGGMALVLHRPYWRDRFSIHVHMRRKADYFEGELAGSVQGLGLRGLVYWSYVVRTDVLTWMLGYMQAVGQMDMLVFNFPWGNAEAERTQIANAQKIIGKAAIACPRNPQGNWPAVEQIPMNSAGLKALQELNNDYFDRHIERLFVGQSMSSGQDKGTGLGGTGRALFAKDTKDEILVYDTSRLDSTFSCDLVEPLKRYNYPWAQFPVRYKSTMPDVRAKEKVQSGQVMIRSGIPIKLDEFREAGGFSRPKAGEEVIAQPMPGAPPMVCIMGAHGPELPPQYGGPFPGSMLPQNAPPGMNPPGAPPQVTGQGPPGAQLASPYPSSQNPMLSPGPFMGHQFAPNAPYGPVGYPNGSLPGSFGSPVYNDATQSGAVPTAGPRMAEPGGGNTYIPTWRRNGRLKRNDQIGFTRYSNQMNYGESYRPEDFEARIAENPFDPTPHGVYADWLTERAQESGDPRQMAEAEFRRSMWNWMQGHGEGYGPHAPAHQGNPEVWRAWPTLLPEGVDSANVSRAFEAASGDPALGSYVGHGPIYWGTYQGMEEGLRRAFMRARGFE